MAEYQRCELPTVPAGQGNAGCWNEIASPTDARNTGADLGLAADW